MKTNVKKFVIIMTIIGAIVGTIIGGIFVLVDRSSEEQIRNRFENDIDNMLIQGASLDGTYETNTGDFILDEDKHIVGIDITTVYDGFPQ